MRPATRAGAAAASSASPSPSHRAWISPALWSGRKSFGYGFTPRARSACSFFRLTTVCSWSSGIVGVSRCAEYWLRWGSVK